MVADVAKDEHNSQISVAIFVGFCHESSLCIHDNDNLFEMEQNNACEAHLKANRRGYKEKFGPEKNPA